MEAGKTTKDTAMKTKNGQYLGIRMQRFRFQAMRGLVRGIAISYSSPL
tara:strand:- start:2976 stop:3119 length:144 start_codon:yes stop_codon:yes gene_type:complete